MPTVSILLLMMAVVPLLMQLLLVVVSSHPCAQFTFFVLRNFLWRSEPLAYVVALHSYEQQLIP